MSSRLLLGPLLVLAWQVAPITAIADSSGRYRITLGYGGGQLESRRLGAPASRGAGIGSAASRVSPG